MERWVLYIDFKKLKENGIKLIIFDIDNTLKTYEEFNVNQKKNKAALLFVFDEAKRLCKYILKEQENSSFKATFTNMEMTECKWLAHDGQQPDEE